MHAVVETTNNVVYSVHVKNRLRDARRLGKRLIKEQYDGYPGKNTAEKIQELVNELHNTNSAEVSYWRISILKVERN